MWRFFNIFTSLPYKLNRYSHDEEAADDQEETGWKLLHGDVFRFPKHKSLLAAALGSGTQLFTLYVSCGALPGMLLSFFTQ